ncbi:MAG: efflux RND transporter periplasmic adaptor subunit [Hyphomicrobiaceae bacterium]|nr:efflux RND transporter periplasmic adaptor subunit [Hyphomicrobiaceae bacterium]
MPKKLIVVLVLVAGAGLALFSQLYAREESDLKKQQVAANSLTTDGHEGQEEMARTALLKAKSTNSNKKSGQKYTCPMHPHYIANEEGNCPICGMELVPLAGDDEDKSASAEQTGRGTAGPRKRKPILIAAETIQNMGVRIAKVEKVAFGRQIRAYGIVKENEKMQQVVSNRLDGWIEELKVLAVGDPVKKGALLYKIYSPELFVSQRDYLSTIRGKGRDSSRKRATAQRLRSYGVQTKALRLLARKGKVMMKMPFYAESSGVVSKLMVAPGSFVKRGAMIAMIQDYSKVWLMVSIAEQDLGFLTKRSTAQVTFPTMKGRTTTARIDYIYPTVDATSRTGQVRLVIDNKDGRLRPGTYADVVFKVGTRQKLAVPTESLLRSETGRYVIMATGEGRFEPRNVKTGLTTEGLTEIVEGLNNGDDIVVSGQFLLDSESALRESFRKLQRLQTPLPLLELDDKQMALVDHLVDAALYIHENLRKSRDIEASFIQPAYEIRNLMWADFRHTQLAPVLNAAQKAIGNAQKARSTSRLRAALDDLVKGLRPWMLEGRPYYYQSKGLALFKEDKAKGRGRMWVQQGDKSLNPYGKGKPQRIAWPNSSKIPVAVQKSSNDQQANLAMRGSHAQ